MRSRRAGYHPRMRSIADQDEAELGGPLSVLVRQQRDHVKLDLLLEELSETAGDQQDALLHRIARLVFPHAFAEESVLWPELRRQLPEGDQLTLKVEQEHQVINEVWTALEREAVGTDRQDLIERLVALLRQDVRDEEDELLPQLQQALSVSRLRALGVTWEAVRRSAPTRPHPAVARRPPGNALSALPLTVLDRTRDLLDAGARRSAEPAARRLTAASQAVRRATDRLDRLPPFRGGEDPSTRS